MNKPIKISHHASLYKQKGMALIMAMLILPLLFALGVLVMNNSFLGLKVVDTRVMQNESNMILNGSANELMGDSGSQTLFASFEETDEVDAEDEANEDLPIFEFEKLEFDADDNNEVNLSMESLGEMACKRTMKASGSNIQCKYLQLNFEHDYGRARDATTKWAKNRLSLGVEQPIFTE